ncbi:phosphate acetyltransferase [Legionella spiritensis]|uniref:Phosphate acetyltransferase n=1 Tax=Legionella spiritensis TaxID=452 RepID=A0A0W0YY56_LEGSP|nr:phosphate acetyltransferase [Legionella spiritensis]KTD61794.1 phosphate acetyl/butaryl transferase [Legionella spiritensis]SNV38213.1 phosphate acetyl/butaryl transferase [Legionella spiritensis]
MQRKIYVTGIEKRCGKSLISLGILTALKEQYSKMTCHKLFSESDNYQVPLLEDISHSTITPLMDINQGMLLMRHQPEDLVSLVFEKTPFETQDEIAYFEGTDFESDNDVFEYQFNLILAAKLDCDVILVISAYQRSINHTLSLVNNALETGKKHHANIVGIIVNRVPEQEDHNYQQRLLTDYGHLAFIITVPEFETLANPRVREIAQKLNAKIICGHNELHRPVRQMTVAAKTVANFLESRLERSGMLIITPSDRIDILFGSLLADQSAHYPKIAGIVLTGGEMPGAFICEIIGGLKNHFPVLLTQYGTYETATILYSAKYNLSKDNPAKVTEAIESIRPYISQAITKLLHRKPEFSHRLSPSVFLYELTIKARQKKRHIVLPEGFDKRVLVAADYLLKRNIVDITLLGNPEKIHLAAKRLELELPNVRIINIENNPCKEQYAKQYFQLRQHKNVNLPIALERMTDINYYAAMMVYSGDADGMVSGAAHTTADTVRPALEIIKTKPGVSRVSSIFIMCLPSRVLIYGDCAINPEPDSATLSEITTQAVIIAKRLGFKPKVALLSYSSGSSGKGDSVDKVVQAMKLVKQAHPDLLVEGPIQYDAAVDPEVARKKLPNSKVAGDANILIFPDLNTGNNTYKAVQRESGAMAIGPVLLGLNKPVNDLSRGCTPQDVINTILITAIQVEGD